MSVKKITSGLLLLVLIAVIITVAAYFVNFWLFSSNSYLTPLDAFFLEGMALIIFGALFLIGSGGMNVWTLKAAILAAVAGAYGQDTVGPREAMERDRWKPQGFTRFALVVLLTGFFMILAYFVGQLLHL